MKNTHVQITKRSIEKMAAAGAQMLASMTGGTVTTVVEYTPEPGGKEIRIEVTRGVLKGP
jgi:hypothetical protein